MGRAISQKDIAKTLGVTQAAVSMALKGHPGISEELKAQVNELCKARGYTPNYNAVSLVKKETKVISVVMTWLLGLGEGVAELVGHLQMEVNARGYKFRLDQGHVLDGIMAERSADGFILIDCPEGYDSTMVSRSEIPMIYGGGASRPLKCNSVPMDNYGGAVAAVRHLRELGHTKIAFFGLIEDNPLCSERFEGYRDALESCCPIYIATSQWFSEPSLVDEYSSHIVGLVEQGVTAFLASSDVAAVGVIRALTANGIKVPGDVSVIGFDDSLLAKAWMPALTTVHLDNKLAAQMAVSDLMTIIKEAGEIEGKVIPTKLVVRSTTAPVNKVV